MGRRKRHQERFKAHKVVKVLRDVQDGDVILMRNTELNERMMNRIAEAMRQTGRPNCLLISVAKLEDVTTLSEADMLELGWQKVPPSNGVEQGEPDGDSTDN